MENEQRYFEMTASSNKLLRSSFLYMILGLLVTFLVPVYMIFFNNNLINFIIRGYYAILIAEVILVSIMKRIIFYYNSNCFFHTLSISFFSSNYIIKIYFNKILLFFIFQKNKKLT